jgi:ribose transport system substrate-binding protein
VPTVTRTTVRSVSLGVLAVAAVVALGAGLLVGRAASGGSSDPAATAGAAPVAGSRIDVIVKATDSEFWQSMMAGSEKAGADLGVQLGLFGPTSETDIAQQVSLVENSISRGAEAIVLASNSSTALDDVVNRARAAGIKVVTVDNAIGAQSEGFIGTDNVKAGQQAGQRMCDLLTRQGNPAGKVLHESAVSGVQVLIDRFEGFRSGLATGCPDAQIIQTLVNGNDLNTAVGQVNDALTRTPDLAGIFADNNTSGTGTARAVGASGRADALAVVAFDSDPAEVEAVRTGAIDAILVQNPFFFGYQGVVEAAMALQGSTPPVNLDPGAVLVDSSNVGDPALAALLDPPTTTG